MRGSSGLVLPFFFLPISARFQTGCPTPLGDIDRSGCAFRFFIVPPGVQGRPARIIAAMARHSTVLLSIFFFFPIQPNCVTSQALSELPIYQPLRRSSAFT